MSILIFSLSFPLFIYNLVSYPSLEKLDVDIQLDSILSVKVCNPTFFSIATYNKGISPIQIEFLNELDAITTVNFSNLATVNGFAPVDSTVWLMPRQCEVLLFESVEDIQLIVGQNKRLESSNAYFRIRILLFSKLATFSYPEGGQIFESQWYEIE